MEIIKKYLKNYDDNMFRNFVLNALQEDML
jgi:hypothetical protein